MGRESTVARQEFGRHVWLGVAAFALILSGLVIALRATDADHETHNRYRDALALAQHVVRLEQLASELRAWHMQLAVHLRADGAGALRDRRAAAQLDALRATAARLRTEIDALRAAPASQREELQFGALQRAVDALVAPGGGGPDAGSTRVGTSARAAPPPSAEAHIAALERALTALLAAAHGRMETAVRQVSQADDLTHKVLTAVSAATLLIGAVIGWLAWRALLANQRMLSRLDQLAHEDGLTGVLNRRGLDERLPQEIARTRRLGYALTAVMLDLDHFKRYNDKHGHGAGDALLREAAQAWSRQLRPTDLLARYGGEEFTLLLPACDAPQAQQLVERLRPLVPDSQTFSAGIAEWDTHEGPVELLARADKALMRAKKTGRNRTVIAGIEPQMTLPLRAVS
jgi:diguanylate cyclase (GGDEF)-like protein